MKLFSFPENQSPAGRTNRIALIALALIAFGGAGTLVVKAADNPEIYEAIVRFNRPVRRAVEPYLPRPQVALPQIFQRRNTVPVQALGYAPRTERLQPLPRLAPEPLLPKAARIKLPEPALATAAFEKAIAEPRSRGRHKLSARGEGRGAPVAMNYCVRLCDGFAFPIGQAGGGSWNLQESACRSACPGAETALFHSPAGAQDFDALARGPLSYKALPTAFRYREKLTNACSCRPAGATQSSLALLSDRTLRKGDLAMTRVGVRHFDGAERFPYKAGNFSDALARVKSKHEVALIRGMETASLRGILPASAPPGVRARVIADIRHAERLADTAAPVDARGLPRGFVELTARERRRPLVLKVVKRTPGFVAMN